ncbi:MAG: hypothetical protein ACPG8W_03065 [Candidatus Promineifilaceae bacterium]
MPEEFIFVTVVIFVMLSIYAYRWWANRKRRHALVELADNWMYQYSAKDDELRDSLDAFYLLSRGRRKRTNNVMRGKESGVEVTFFDYRHTTGGGRSSKEHYESVVMLRSSRLELPFFSVRPKGVFEFMRKRFGKTAVELADGSQFDEKYLVFPAKEADPEPIKRVLKMSVRDQLTRDGKLILEGDRDRLLIFRTDKLVKVDEMRTFLDEAIAIFQQLAKSDGWSY